MAQKQLKACVVYWRNRQYLKRRLEKAAICLLLFNLLAVSPCFAFGPPPFITVQPANQVAQLLGSATFQVVAFSETTLSYQWLKNGTNISNATASSFTIASVQSTDQATYAVNVTNGGGSVTSSNATLTILTAPVITTQPTNPTVTQGQTANFSVVASGTPNLSYQWYFNNAKMGAGSTSSTLAISGAGTNNAGNYTAVVKNNYGTVTSAVAVLTIYIPPTITSQPQNLTVIQGQNVMLSVAANGTAPLSYQWQTSNSGTGAFTNLANDGQILGASTNILQIANVTTNNALFYQVIISNIAGVVTSSPAILKVVPPVLVDVQFLGTSGTIWTSGSGSPQTGAAILGASGDAWNQVGLTYYIYPGTSTDINAAPIVNSANTASGLTLTVGSSPNSVFGGHEPNATATDPTTTNLMSSDIEQFVLTQNVDVWTITVGGLSSYSGDQFNLVVYAGAPSARTQTISVTGGASGGNTGSALTTSSANRKLSSGAGDAYQIFTNGTLNGSNLVFTVNGGTAAADAYAAFVNGFQLQIFSYPVITTQPASQTNVAGSTVQFSAGAAGGLLSYQWQTNGASGFANVGNGGIFSGANSNVLTIAGAPGYSALSYQVIVTNNVGSVTSAPATLSLIPQISTQPASQAAFTGDNGSFTVVADGSAPLSYQWNFNGTNIYGATNASLTFNNVVTTNAGNYNVMVLNSFGSATSVVAALTVTNPAITLAPIGGASLTSTGYTFQISVPVGCTYVVLASTDLQNWIPIATNVAVSASETITDASATNYCKRFYRAMVPQ